MQKIWVCGARGQIGQAVNDVVDKLEFEMLDTDVDDLDVTDTDEVLRFGEMNRPDIIINCSGMTDISSCEENPSQACTGSQKSGDRCSKNAGKNGTAFHG